MAEICGKEKNNKELMQNKQYTGKLNSDVSIVRLNVNVNSYIKCKHPQLNGRGFQVMWKNQDTA